MSSTSALNSLLSSASSSSAPSVNLSSLLTAATGATSPGIDVTSAVEAAIYAAQAPERQWQAEQSTIQSQITALTSIQTAAANLSSDLQNLSDPLGALAARVVSSSNNAAVTATAQAGTATGTHSIAVSQLATAASWYSPVIANGSGASLGSSLLTITQVNGTITNFDLGSSQNNTLSSLVQSINDAHLGITASVVQDASGSRLALVGASTGASAGFTVGETGVAASTWNSATLPSASAPVVAGTYQLSDGSSTTTLNLPSGTTLSGLADQINSSGLSVSATVVSGAGGAHLSISSSDGQQVALSADPGFSMTQASAAANALLTVDGVPVSSASNTVSGALSGVTLVLSGATLTNTPAILSVTADSTQISSAVSKFVTDYNSTLSLISSQFTYNAANGSQGILGSDSTVRSMQSTLLASVGFSPSASHLSLADLGISMQDDGTLQLNASTLDQSIASNADEISDFFQNTNGFAANMASQVKAFSQLSGGSLAVDIGNLTQQYNNLQSDVNNFESGYIASQKTLLTSMYSKAEIALQSLPSTLKQIQAELNGNSGN